MTEELVPEASVVLEEFFEKLKIKDEKEEVKFDNSYVLQKIKEQETLKVKKIIEELKVIYPLNDELLLKIYNKSISIHQSKNQGSGDFLENQIVLPELKSKKIFYKQQVIIDKKGIIVGFNEKKNKCSHIIDFVIGKDIEVGKSINEFKVISCKTTCRERWTQDDWSFTCIPEKFILLTLSNDYPSSERFREDEKRKIITCNPKIKDDRKYKLNFENLVEELN